MVTMGFKRGLHVNTGGVVGLNIFNNTIEYNNVRHYDVQWGAGGIKLITECELRQI